jgi:hypothetical protein
MHQSSPVQRLWYGLDHQSFYLRLDFQTGVKFGEDLPPELNLFWFYENKQMINSRMPLVELPDEAPLNYRFHHHLAVNLLTQTVWFQEAGEYDKWHSRATRAQVGIDTCLELSIPWADLQVDPDSALRIVAVLSDGGRYRQYLPENALIPITSP